MRYLSASMLLVIGLLACESTSSPVPVYERTVTAEMLTGAALEALRSDGRLTIPVPQPLAPSISLSDARVQTLQFARYVTNHGLLRGVVENERGGFWTDPHLLSICDDAYYVRSQIGPIVHDSLGEPGLSYIKRLGPQWLIPLCGSANEPQMTVQVAIDGNDIRFANGVPVEPYAFIGGAWNARGVPLNWPDALTISAERAVRFAWETFGVRVTEVPQIFTRGDFAPDGRVISMPPGSARSCHRWRVVLENDVTIRGTTSLRTDTTNVVYIGALTCQGMDVEPFIHLPLAEQPPTTTLQYLDEDVSPPKTWSVTIPFSSPVRFEVGLRAR